MGIYLKQNTCDDVINRQDVKNALYNAIKIRELNYRQAVILNDNISLEVVEK